jgi:DNA-binding IclR family transcriptional regulator
VTSPLPRDPSLKRNRAASEPAAPENFIASGSQAIGRALGILLNFTMEAPSLTLTDIAGQTGLTMPTAHRMIKALQKAGFVVQHAVDGSYRLGPAIVRLSQVALSGTSRSTLAAVCMPYLEQLRDETGESAGLHMPSTEGRICVAEAESRHMMRMATGVGREFPWHAGAASKALLSAMTPDERLAALTRAPWETFASATPDDKTRLLEEIARIERRGYALSFSETVEGASAIAMPIRAADHHVIAAINVAGPVVRWTRKRILAAVPTLRSAVRSVERELGAEE